MTITAATAITTTPRTIPTVQPAAAVTIVMTLLNGPPPRGCPEARIAPTARPSRRRDRVSPRHREMPEPTDHTLVAGLLTGRCAPTPRPWSSPRACASAAGPAATTAPTRSRASGCAPRARHRGPHARRVHVRHRPLPRLQLSGLAASGCVGAEPEGLGDQLVGAPAGGVVVGDRDHDHLLGVVLGGDLLDPARTWSGVPSTSRRPPACRAGPRREEALGRLGRRHRDQPPAAQHRHRHPRWSRAAGLLLAVGGDRPDRDDRARRGAARSPAKRSR